jgi:lipid-A-disaccharide synthase-like uncharacterized protein
VLSWIGASLLLIGMILSARHSIWNWPVNIIGSLLLVVHFIIKEDLALVIFNVVVIIICIAGWKRWLKRT